MKSLLISVVVVTAAMSVACAKKSKHETPAPTAAVNKPVDQATVEDFTADLKNQSWSSSCSQNQQKTRISFRELNLMYVNFENCSRGQKTYATGLYWYEVSAFNVVENSALVKLSDVVNVAYGPRDTMPGKGAPVQAFTVLIKGDELSLKGDSLNFIEKLNEQGLEFSLEYKRVQPVQKQEAVAGV